MPTQLGLHPLCCTQGTTCVYSRKVEYLHRLVMQVLDVIDHKLSKEMRKDAAADGDGDQDAESAFPADPEFISLDDIPEAKSSAIDMAEKNDDTCEGADDDMMSGPLVVMMNMEVDTDNPDPNKDLRLSCAMMHESGALLLDPCSASHLDMNLLPRKSLATSEIGNSSFSPERIRADQSPSTANVLTGLDNEEAGAAAGGGISPLHVEPEVDYGGDDSDGDAGGLDAPDIDDAEEALNGGGAVLSALHGASTNDVEEEDLWRVLDPHDSSSHAAKPYKKGRTVRRPPPASKSAEAAMSIDLWAKQTRSLKAPTLPEFSEVFLQERNRLLKLRLAAAKARGGARSGRSTHKPPGSGMAVSKMMDLLDLEEEDFDVPVAGGPDGGAFEGGVDSSDDVGGDFPDAGDFGMEGEEDVVYSAGTPRKSVQMAGSRSGRGQAWEDMSYEDLCKSHVEQYLRGVDDMLHRSALESRVRDWRR